MKASNHFARLHRLLAVIGLLTLTTLAATAAHYRVEHNFRLKPGGNQVPVIRGKYYCHAWTTETRPDCPDYAVNPNEAAQPLGWGPFGTDVQHGRQGPVRNSGNGGGRVEAQTGQVPIPATGFDGIEWATASDCDAYADANSEWHVNAAGAGGDVTGTIVAWGEATAAGAPHRTSTAYAFSMTSIEAQGSTLKKGKLRWHSVVRDTVRGNARSQKDPVDYHVTDLVTGERHQGTLLAISMDMLPTSIGGGITWDSNRVVISATDLNFNIELPGRFTSLTGRLDLQIRGGVVASSFATGIYAGSVPPVGAAVPLEFDVVNDIEFDYDLSSLTPAGNDVDVTLEMYGSGEAIDEKAFEEIPFTLTTATPTGDPGLSLVWPVTPSAVYTVETSPVLTGGTWQRLPLVPQEHLGLNFVKISNALPAQFFRLSREVSSSCQILIHQPPQSVTVPIGAPATFFVEAGGNPVPEKFQWQRSDAQGDFTDIPGENGPALFFDPGSEPFTNHVWFRCVIGNGCTTVISAEATLTVQTPQDTTPPMVQFAFSECPAPVVVVMFSEPVLPELAMIPNNYQLRSLNITGPRVLQVQPMGPNVMRLFLSGPIAPTGTVLTVRNVRDLAGNPIPPANATPVQCGGVPPPQ